MLETSSVDPYSIPEPVYSARKGGFSRESRRHPSSLMGQLNDLDLEVDAWWRSEAEH